MGQKALTRLSAGSLLYHYTEMKRCGQHARVRRLMPYTKLVHELAVVKPETYTSLHRQHTVLLLCGT